MTKRIFISGINTSCGKSIATGLMARYILKKGQRIITQKIVQTGCENMSDDIIQHRKIMGVDVNKYDRDQTTCPYIFKFPASPHLAAQLENKLIDVKKIVNSTQILSQFYDYILIEGVGGLYVPLNKNTTILDYIKSQNLPLIIVSSAELGSINHTLMSIEIAFKRKINVKGIIYNHYPVSKQEILNDSRKIFQHYLTKFFPNASIVNIPIFNSCYTDHIDFNKFIR